MDANSLNELFKMTSPAPMGAGELYDAFRVATGREARTSAERQIEGEVTSGRLGAEALYDDRYRDYIEASDDPRVAVARLNGASLFSRAMGVPFEEALDNFDSLQTAWYGQNASPLTTSEALRNAFEQGVRSMQIGNLWAKVRDGIATEEDRRRLEELEADPVPVDLLERSLPVEILKAAMQSIPYSATGLAGGLAGKAALGGIAALVLPEGAAAIAAIATIGRTLGSIAATYASMGGLEYRDMVKAGMSHDAAAVGSRWSGLLQSLVESDQIMGLLPTASAKKSLVGAMQKVVGEGLLKGKWRNPLITFAMRQASRALGEGAEEALQEGISSIVYEITRQASNESGGAVEAETWDEVGKAIVDNFVQGAMASLPMGALGEPWAIAQDVGAYRDWKATEALKKAAEARAQAAAAGPEAKPGDAAKPQAIPQPKAPVVFKELASREPMEDGSIRAQLRGNPDAKAKVASVQADYTWNPEANTVVLDALVADKALEKKDAPEAFAQMGSALSWIRRQYPEATIEWSPGTKAGKLLKSQFEAASPGFFGPDWQDGAAAAAGDGRRAAFVGKLVSDAGLDEKTAEDVAVILDARATKKGMTTDAFIEEYFTPEMIQAGLSPRGQSRVAKGDIGNPYGQTSFWKDGKEITVLDLQGAAVQAKATLHFAQKGNTSGVIHELFGHGLIHTLDADERTLFERYVGKPMADWGVEEHERVATDMEKYFETGKAPTKELQPVFARLAEFVKQVIEAWISQKKLTKPAIDAFDALFAATDTEAEVSSRRAQREADAAAGIYRMGREARRKRKAAARSGKAAAAEPEREGGPEDLFKVEGWHGTKHQIAGRFSLGKAGSGEGGAVYGHGAYIAERSDLGREVARNYATLLGDNDPQYELDGKPAEGIAKTIGYAKFIDGKTRDQAIKRLKEIGKYGGSDDAQEVGRIYDQITRVPNRRVYEMTIEDPRGERFLDLDRAVPDDQFELVLKEAGLTRDDLTAEYDPAAGLKFNDIRYALGRFIAGDYTLKHPTKGYRMDPRSGLALYKAISNALGGDREASAFLDRAGFTGNTYIGDWAKSRGEGVQDYVVFNDAYLREPAEAELFGGARRGTVEIGGYATKSEKDGSIVVYGDVEEIRSLMPQGVVGKAGKDEIAFSSSQRPRVIAALKGESLIYSRRGQVHSNPRYKSGEKAGQYIGAPEAYNTPAKIPGLRKLFNQLALEGTAGRFWYENSGRAVLAATGGDVAEAKKFAALLAIYSPQAKVDSNTTFAIRAWAQYKAGKPIKVKTGVQDRQASEVLYEGKLWSGEKTNNFYNNLLREIDDLSHSAAAMGVTVDMWMMRAAGYETDQPTTAAYRFVENETNRLAQQLGWEPQQVQAAIWVAMKARTENKQVKADTEAESERRGWIRYDGDGKRVVLDAAKHRKNWLDHAMALDVSKDDTTKAKFDFADGLARHQGQVSWEARPGRSTGVLAGINDAPFEVQQAFQRDAVEALLDSNGSDILAARLGLLKLGAVDAPGVWQSEVAAGRQELMVMSTAQGANADVGVLPEQADLIETYCAVIGYLFRQEGVGWHRPFWNGRVSEENGLQIDIGRPLSAAEAKGLWEAVDRTMREAGFPDWEGSAGMISSDVGMRLVSFGLTDNPTAIKLFMQAANEWISPLNIEGRMDHFRSDGNLVMNDWTEDRDGQTYRSRISRAGRSDILGWAVDVLGPNVQALFDKYADLGFGNPGRVPGLAETRPERLLEGGVGAQDDGLAPPGADPASLEGIDGGVAGDGRGAQETLRGVVHDLGVAEDGALAGAGGRDGRRGEGEGPAGSLEGLTFGGADDRDLAAGFSSFEEFRAAYEAAHPLDDGDPDAREGYLRSAWLAAHPKRAKGPIVSADEANRAFLSSLEANGFEGLSDFLTAVGAVLQADKRHLKKGLSPLDIAALRVASGRPMSEAGLRTLMATIRRDPAAYRARFAQISGDAGMRAQLEAERAGEAPAPEVQFGPLPYRVTLRNAFSRLRAAAEELDDDELRELYADGRVAYGDALEGAKAAREEVRALQNELEMARGALADWRSRFSFAERRISEQNKLLREAKLELKKAQALARVQKTEAAKERLAEAEAAVEAIRADIRARVKRLPAGSAIRDTAYDAARESARATKARIEAKIAEAKAKQAARDTAIALARKILAPVSKNCDYRVAQEIRAIQKTIDPHFRRKIMEYSIEDLRALFREAPDVSKILPADVVERLERKPLNLWTIAELEDLAKRVDNLRELGRLRLAERRLAKKTARLERQEMLMRRLRDSGKLRDAPMTGSIEFERDKDRDEHLLKKWDRSLVTMARVARMLDNGEEKGWWYNTVVERERDCYRQEAVNFNRRWSAIERKMEELGITPEDLYGETVKVGDWTITKADALGLYIGLQDADTAAKIAYGNMLTEDQRKSLPRESLEALGEANLAKAWEAAQTLGEKERALAAFLIEDGSREFDRLAEACYQYENREPPKVAIYFPNEVRGRSGEDKLVDQMREDLLGRTPRLGRGVPKGNTIARVKIAPEHQLPINLDALAVYKRGIERQEHYIAYAEYVADTKLLLQNDRSASQVRYLVRQTHGQGVLDYMDEWLEEVANPKAYSDYAKTLSGFEQAFRALRGPLGMAYLGFRTSTAVRQLVTSPIPYLPYAGGQMVGQMLRHLNLAEYLRQAKVVKEKSAFVANRQMSPTVAAIKEYAQSEGVSKAMKIAARYSLVMIEAADMWAVVTGWTAVYERKLAELTKEGKLSAAEIEREAVREADRVTIESQPTGRRADVAPAFKSHSEVQKFLLQFQSPLNVVYNQLFHDVPADVAEGRLGRAAAIVSGYLATGAILALLAAPRGDEDDDEDLLKRIFAGALRQPFDAIPLAGAYAGDFTEALITGDRRFRGSQDVFPALSKLFQGAGNVMGADSEEAFWKGVTQFAEGTGMSAGVPVSALKEYYRVFFEGDLGAALGKPKK